MLNDKENRKALKSEIESLLSGMNHQEFDDLNADQELMEDVKPESPYDFDEMTEGFNRKAQEITDSLFEYYVELGILEENNYVKLKKEMDTINMSNIFFQIKTLKITITKIIGNRPKPPSARPPDACANAGEINMLRLLHCIN